MTATGGGGAEEGAEASISSNLCTQCIYKVGI
jgi:hypothetical protein